MLTSQARSTTQREPKTMRALVAINGVLTTATLPRPRQGVSEVLVRVAAVGLCRTDLHVAAAAIPTPERIVPGHEFSGTVAAAGRNVRHVHVGDRVAVNPIVSCGDCEPCRAQSAHDCPKTKMLGVDFDGACAEFVVVPGSAVCRVPDSLSFEAVAFAEPVAASLALVKADIHRDQTGLIVGDNRIAQLSWRVLRAHGFSQVSVCAAATAERLPDSRFDFVIETCLTESLLTHILRTVRRRGRIILKSRQHAPVGLKLNELLPKEVIFQAVHYGRFEAAVSLLTECRVRVDDLIGERFTLDDFEAAFALAYRDEGRKTFFVFDRG